MMRCRGKISLILAAAWCIGGAFIGRCNAQAQPTTAPVANSADAVLDRMLSPASQAPAPIAPMNFPGVTTPATAGALALGQPIPPTVREGTYMENRTGQLSKSADGSQSIFTFDPPSGPIPDQPLVILPNLKLQMMEQETPSSGQPARFRVTGMVTEYRNQNYFLIDKVDGARTDAQLIPTAAAPQPPPATLPSDASASEILDRMLKPASQSPTALMPISDAAPMEQMTTVSVAPGSVARSNIHEGATLVDRTGRLSKSADGHTIFTFDADGRAMQDPPVIILPNMKLEMLEQAKGSANRDLRFRVTGMCTEYRNHNYLLLDKVVVIPDVVQQF